MARFFVTSDLNQEPRPLFLNAAAYFSRDVQIFASAPSEASRGCRVSLTRTATASPCILINSRTRASVMPFTTAK